MNLDLNWIAREAAISQTYKLLEDYLAKTKELKVAGEWDIEEVKEYAKCLTFDQANELDQVINHVTNGLRNYAVHTPHPNYFGLFNPRSNFASILADLITATYNPQLAAWSHAPFANEIERRVIDEFGKKIGYSDPVDGTFCSGGAEANLTALLCALNQTFPNFNQTGIQGITVQPLIYCSSESHHSIEKAAKITGLGAQSVKYIPVQAHLQMDLDALRQQIEVDLQRGLFPLMIVGTAGTTGAGAIDDLEALHKIAQDRNIWFHVDAAYGGAIVVSQKYRSQVAGIELGDSLTIDLHKWFSVPMGASLLLTKDRNILHQSFAVKTAYMPKDGDTNMVIDPYVHSVQWSRRFIGLKIFLPLAVHGWEGYEQIINRQIELGQYLKTMLLDKGWSLANCTPLPILCFTRTEYKSDEIIHLVNKINASGKAWLSVYPVQGVKTARVCITNYLTGEEELSMLIDLLNQYQAPISKVPDKLF